MQIGLDIGSTMTKCVVMDGDDIRETILTPTGFSSVDTAERVAADLAQRGYDVNEVPVVATGYGRIAVPYAAKKVTEITCHGRGATYLFGPDGTVLDVGGQDTKVIQLVGGKVKKFLMNDKCSAGTGKFLEVMANRMGVSQQRMAELAASGEPTAISSMCTVFAESEVISLVGRGEPLENIANGVIDSVVGRVATLVRGVPGEAYFLTGGLCENDYVIARLADKLGKPVTSCPETRYAGAIGAALS